MEDAPRALGLPVFPVTAMTAHVMAGDGERCLECGMDENAVTRGPVRARAAP
jgi:CheY-like chemotaxis protein